MARGGARAGAGRKKTGKRVGGPHRRRPEVDPRRPLHVVLRSEKRLSWRDGRAYRVLRRVLGFYLGNPDFRICHISIQKRHLHLIVEAASRKALTLGMKSFATRAARALNNDSGSCGKVFAYRYHSTQITTARYARHALAYVLNNWRRHREDFANGRMLTAYLDEYSSALSFDGWTMTFARPRDYEPLPVSAPETWLLRDGWKRYGRIDPHECPGPLEQSFRW
jgi:REP element-mobilizing transposase RayT